MSTNPEAGRSHSVDVVGAVEATDEDGGDPVEDTLDRGVCTAGVHDVKMPVETVSTVTSVPMRIFVSSPMNATSSSSVRGANFR